jgi:hypothetical protein
MSRRFGEHPDPDCFYLLVTVDVPGYQNSAQVEYWDRQEVINEIKKAISTLPLHKPGGWVRVRISMRLKCEVGDEDIIIPVDWSLDDPAVVVDVIKEDIERIIKMINAR